MLELPLPGRGGKLGVGCLISLPLSTVFAAYTPIYNLHTVHPKPNLIKSTFEGTGLPTESWVQIFLGTCRYPRE